MALEEFVIHKESQRVFVVSNALTNLAESRLAYSSLLIPV